MTFQPNQAGIDRLFAEIAAKIERIDRELRDEFTGNEDLDAITAAAASRFSAAGVNLVAAELRDYATSIRDNEPYQIQIQ